MLSEQAGRQWAEDNRDYLKQFVTYSDAQRTVYLWDTAGVRDPKAPPQKPITAKLDKGRKWFEEVVSGFISVDRAGDVVLVEDGVVFAKDGPVFGIQINPQGGSMHCGKVVPKEDRHFALSYCVRQPGEWEYTEEQPV